MFTFKDWLSFFVGIAVGALGLLPLLAGFGMGPEWFNFDISLTALAYVIAGAGFYLLIDAFSEIANSNGIGWFTALLGIVFMGVGVLKVLSGRLHLPEVLQFAWISPMIFSIILIIEGIFLMIATFAMEI